MSILKDVWGETIKKIGVFMVLAMALFSVPALGQGTNALVGEDGVDILQDGIFETNGAAFSFPVFQDTNFDAVAVGNDNALAFGWNVKDFATAQNNLEIKKNQDSGDCECCQALDPTCPCQDCCYKVNIEQIKVGDRTARAFGFATATNNIKIVTNQQ
jgi:hypothetical protein